MTKTLTEQLWREELPSGYYYIKNKEETYIHEIFMTQSYKVPDGLEVLAPVPSYDEWKEISESEDQAHAHLQDEREKNMCLEESVRILEKQLAIATKALKEIHDCTDFADDAFIYATEALKEIEEWGVK